MEGTPENQPVKRPWYKRVPWWGWVAAAVVVIIIASIGTIGNGVGTDTPTATPSEVTPSVTPTPTATTPPPATETTSGLTGSTARVACDAEGNKRFPYGYKPHWITQLRADRIVDDRWFEQYGATVTDAANASRDVMISCTVEGTQTAPQIFAYLIN